jgi:molybdopterin/thiamine biosynthesis adenylyltransferase
VTPYPLAIHLPRFISDANGTATDVRTKFDYEQAFSRNIGWVTAAEQSSLRGKRIAIAGLGGVGGSHLLTLARLGIGAFNIADPDQFDLVNFNRQAGASLASIGRSKAEVLAEMALDINPTLDLKVFDQGVGTANLPNFLDGVDLYVDGLDFFAFEARQATFAACTQRNIPAVTAAPLGMGAAVLSFLPGQCTFADYFRLAGCSPEQQAVRFLVGLSPAMLQRGYLVDELQVSFSRQRGPSTAIACSLCAGLAACEATKILLRRGRVLAAPWGYQFDAYRNRLVRTWRPGGNANPLQRLTIVLANRHLAKIEARRGRL